MLVRELRRDGEVEMEVFDGLKIESHVLSSPGSGIVKMSNVGFAPLIFCNPTGGSKNSNRHEVLDVFDGRPENWTCDAISLPSPATWRRSMKSCVASCRCETV